MKQNCTCYQIGNAKLGATTYMLIQERKYAHGTKKSGKFTSFNKGRILTVPQRLLNKEKGKDNKTKNSLC